MRKTLKTKPQLKKPISALKEKQEREQRMPKNISNRERRRKMAFE